MDDAAQVIDGFGYERMAPYKRPGFIHSGGIVLADEFGADIPNRLPYDCSQKEILMFLQGYKAGRKKGMTAVREAVERAASECEAEVGQTRHSIGCPDWREW